MIRLHHAARLINLALAIPCALLPALSQPARAERIKPHAVLAAGLADPVLPACISSPFGPRILPGHPSAGTFHNGIDLPAPAGAPVRAIAPGTVIRVERRWPGGLQVLVQHHGFIGIYSHFGHVTPAIAEGHPAVYRGEELGVVGHTGLMFGMHLFFGMIIDGRAVNPARYLNVSACKGDRHTRIETVDKDGKLLPTRRLALDR